MDRKRVFLLSDLHYCQEEYGGISRDEKAQRIIEFIHEEHKKDPLSMILFLGDYSLDHWAWNTKGTWLNEGKSYTKQFFDLYMQDLPAPFYMLAGNHEQYDEQQWLQITGFRRSAEYVLGDYLFVLWDSYGDNLNPTEHSDGTYTPIDVAKVRALMAEHPDKKLILCSHYFLPTMSQEEMELIRDPRIVCLFQGHTHLCSVITLPEEYGGKKLLQTGAWASTYTPSTNYPWGARDLYLEDNRVISGYIVPKVQRMYKGNAYTISPTYQDVIEIPTV